MFLISIILEQYRIDGLLVLFGHLKPVKIHVSNRDPNPDFMDMSDSEGEWFMFLLNGYLLRDAIYELIAQKAISVRFCLPQVDP